MECVIYTRVSTDMQEGGLQSQLSSLREWAHKNGHTIVDEFSDEMSAYKDVVREDFEKMKDFVEKNNIKLIVCWELSRFGRSSIKTQSRIKEYQRNGVEVYFLNGNISTLKNDPTSTLQLGILSSFAEYERESIVARSQRGRDLTAKSNKRVGMPTIPYGISVDEDGKLIKNRDEAKVVEQIFNWFLQGFSYHRIAKELNDREKPTRRGGKWGATSVRNILQNPLYIGKRKYRDLIIELGFSFVSDEVFEKAQNQVKVKIGNYFSEKANNRTSKLTNRFKGKVFCGHCNHHYGTASEVLKVKPEPIAKKDLDKLKKIDLESDYDIEYYNKLIDEEKWDELFELDQRESGKISEAFKLLSDTSTEKILYSYRCSEFVKQRCDAGQIKAGSLDTTVTTMLTGNVNYIKDLIESNKKKFNLKENRTLLKNVNKDLANIEGRKKRAKDLYVDDGDDISYHKRMNKIYEDENRLKSRRSKLEQDWNSFYKERNLQLLPFFEGDLTDEDIERLIEKIVIFSVKHWDINWTKLPKKFQTISYDKENNVLVSKEVNGEFNKVPYGSNDKVAYVEVYLFNVDVPIKGTFTSVSENLYVGAELIYNEKTRTLSLG